LIVLRKSTNDFNSIENIFGVLTPFLSVKSVVLPFESVGVTNRFKNILFVLRQRTAQIHITGHDHYLLCYPLKRAILTIHDIEALKRKTGLKRWIFKKLWFDLPIKNAKLITTISQFSKAELLSIKQYQTPIKVISNPLTFSIEFRVKRFNSVSPRILHIGVKENKNLPRLIEALSTISCTLVIVGKPSKEISKMLSIHCIQHEVKMNISQQEIMAEYYACDLLAFVSTYEGFGLPIIEAQAAGRVVLTSNVASMPEVAGHGALLVNPFSINEIKEGILEIINNAELRESLIAQGLVNVQRFNPSTIAQQYTALYNTVLND
jgi:glycosyltransferase involved in cell wall biosynthesis